MQEKTIRKQLDELKAKDSKVLRTLNPILQNKTFAWLILGISFALMYITNFLKINELVGGWNIIVYFLLLIPLVYLIWKEKLVNPHTKWFLPLLLVFIIDMFYYSNDMVQYFLPIVFYVLVVVLYLTSMHKNHSLYQTLIPRFELAFEGITYIKTFLDNLFVRKSDNGLYRRIMLALAITLPFLGIFVALLFSADSNFENFLVNLFDFSFDFNIKYFMTVPLTFSFYLLLFIYGSSNHKRRMLINERKALDILIVSIFLGMIGLLFALFIAIQLPFLFGENYLPEHHSLATFAREGFFQLMIVMGLVMLIFLFIMRRFKGEKVATVLLSFLLIETIFMGLVSLKKMYLYQSIKGATTLRYYVEWFDYFLIVSLVFGLFFLIKKLNFSKLLDVVTVLGLLGFTLVVSLNVDAMVAKHNIEKFANNPSKLDKNAISLLSIDALPIIANSKLVIEDVTRYTRDSDGEVTLPWYQELSRKNCHAFARYHYGYCSKLKAYGVK